MITPRVQIEEGPRIDSFLESVKVQANYIECRVCGAIKELPVIDIKTLSEWEFKPGDLKPSPFFRTIRGKCPTCQEMDNQFKRIL
jgi:hypothetical protein